VQNHLYLGLRAGDIANVRNEDREASTEETAEVSRRMCQLIFFIISVVESDPNSSIVLARCYANCCACEFCRYLIETTCTETAGRARDPEGGDWGMVAGLFGEERETNGFGGTCGIGLGCG